MTTEVALPTRRAGASPRHLLSAEDLDGLGLARLLDRAQLLRTDRAMIARNRPLAGRQVALLFEKPSLRTRVSFEVAVTSLGGHAIALGPDEVGLGRRESAADVARNLSRLVDAVVLRTFAHDTLVEMAEAASVPVINALTDAEHPCQALADLLTLRQRFGRLAGVRLAYVGDGFNVATSLAAGAALTGVSLAIASPNGYGLGEGFVRHLRETAAQHGAEIDVLEDPAKAVRDADVVYTDVWASMGQEDTYAQRKEAFAGFTITADLMALAKPNAIFMHDLPAHRGDEVTDDVIESSQSVVFDQAENRLHAQKAILALVAGDGGS